MRSVKRCAPNIRRWAMTRDSIASAGRLFGNARIRALLLMWWIPPMFFVVAHSRDNYPPRIGGWSP
jgi:hypothetical protein